ncbi:mesA-like protein [Elsinoe australis]|uniref:MesA-like protein n=1 Tax=Elsinoe australis TaxID=40998 RepID=A0A4U7BB41_9PEZI|nr:mesA-like protein [Elsinoe australis]
MAYRPGTSGGGGNATGDNRRPSVVSVPSFMSKHSGSTPSSEDRISSTITKPLDPNRQTVFSFSRPALANHHHSMMAKRKRKVKPQYPADSEEKHVEYILVASFDIDRGSIMEHQYPAPIGGDENMLAELMLPDQAHMRAQDWTMFFLHKDNAEEEELRKERMEKRKEEREERIRNGEEEPEEEEDDDNSDGTLEDEELRSVEGPPLVYVLNLVTTRQDNTVRRGAVCKAMAICTRHPFLHIYKPLLLLALEQYFKNPVVETLASLYDSLNAMDLSLMPKLSSMERMILQASDVRDLFLEKFEALAEQASGDRSAPDVTDSPATGRAKNALPRDTHEFDSVVPYNGVPVPVKIPTALSLETVGDFSLVKLIQTFSNPHSKDPQAFQTVHPHLTTSGPLTHPIIVLLNALLTQKRVVFIGHNLPSSTVAEAVLAACALASGGILRGFVRHAFPYTDLTKIDDLLKVPGFIAGVTNPTFSMHAEWWDLLCDLTTGRMQISKNIEPTPMTEGVAYFQSGGPGAVESNSKSTSGHSSSNSLGGSTPLPNYAGDPTGDNAFINSVLSAINDRHGEGAVRAKFRLWVLKFTRIAAAFEELVYGASALVISTPQLGSSSAGSSPDLRRTTSHTHHSASEITKGYGYVWPSLAEKTRELAANATRIEGWMKTRSYYNYIQDLAVYYSYRTVKDIDLQHCHDKLVKLRLGTDNAASIYTAICNAVHSDEQINHLLVTVVNTSPTPAAGVASATGPAAMQGMGGSGIGGSATWGSAGGMAGGGGLFHLALGLFHPKIEVREKMADLLGRIREHDAGRHFWNRLGGFERAAWERVESGRRDREG